jgi:hypothetical protein
MIEYRQNATTETTTGSSQPTAAPSRAPTFTRLADKYGMSDMRITDQSSLQAQTIEQEFQAYITSQLSTDGTNLMKFWEVRVYSSMMWM